ncbi:MAG: divergent polysaccharide deacetylase family protein [Bdellovibrionales bacterium]
MAHQPSKPPVLLVSLALALLLALLGYAFQAHFFVPPVTPPETSVTIQPPALLHPDQMLPDVVYEQEPPPLPVPAPVPLVRKEGEPARIAVIIDDVGISRQQVAPLFDLPQKVTLAFLPYGHATPAMSQQAADAGYEVMLHLPMQPAGDANPGPDALTVGLDEADVQQRLQAALAKVPAAVGVNNHMGSAATSDVMLMQHFMLALKPTGKFFIDSFTTADSVAYASAQAQGIPTRRRDVFLDNNPSEEAIERQLAQAERLAERHGSTIVIGHPYSSTIAVLTRWLPALESRGIKVVKVSELLGS